jgi:hypothetical protein
MIFVLSKKKLKLLLVKLCLKNVFETAVLYPTKTGLVCYNEEGGIWRIAKFDESFFKFFDFQSASPIEIQCKKMLEILKKRHPRSKHFLVSTYKNHIEAYCNNFLLRLGCNTPDAVKSPFKIINDIPTFDEGMKLNTCFSISLSKLNSIKKIPRFLSYCRIHFDDDIIHFSFYDQNGNMVDIKMEGKIKNGKNLSVSFDRDYIQQIVYSFNGKLVNVCTKTDSPGWFYEKSQEYSLGFMIKPIPLDVDQTS